MINTLPAIVIGGPRHAGKSVLFHSLTHALRERGIRHHAIRACPDGEGNWSQESDPKTVDQIRIKLEGEWPESFVQRICQDLEHRCLPFLVDMGGYPRESQYSILRHCTHSILLLRTDEPERTRFWLQLVEEHKLTSLAWVYSQQDGVSNVTNQAPIIEGTITKLERNQKPNAQDCLLDVLVECIAALFTSYAPQDLERTFFERAPAGLLDLYAFVPSTQRWTPEMLPSFLASLPMPASLSVYGIAPNWVYAALAAYTDQYPFYQFDPRLPSGWVQPLAVRLGTESFPELQVQCREVPDATVLSINILPKHLEYFQPEPVSFPPVRATSGLIINGSIPFWLLTALVRLYKEAGVTWIATYYPALKSAIVAYSRITTYNPGDLVALPSA